MDILNQKINPATAICFSGHRPDRLPGCGNPAEPEAQKLIAVLLEKIEDAVRRGKDTFLGGFMAGFDILAAEQVIALKAKYPHIRLVTVAPYSVQFFTREKCWTPEWVKRAKEIIRQHDIGVSLAEHYRSGIYYERNRTLVNYSSELICYWDGNKGGTQHTVNFATDKGLAVFNLYH